MPLSIYKPGKSKDYRFLDKLINQQFQVSGTLIHVHKYIGPVAQGDTGDSTISQATDPNELTIQDVLLIENRDRNYDTNIIDLQAGYTVNDLDFNLTQFGISLNTNILFLNFHINEMIDRLGRKLIPGDVLEVVHRKEEVPLDPTVPYIPAYYVVKDTARAAEGYSPTWLAHILRVRAEPMPDSQEYSQILDTPIKNGLTLEDIISNASSTTAVNDAVVAQGDANTPTKNFDNNNLYVSGSGSTVNQPGTGSGGSGMVDWPFNNDGTIPNTNIKAPTGTRFPENPMVGDWFLRTDYQPSRLFQREDTRWCARQIVWRDRPWTAGDRTLEDFLDPSITTVMPDNQSFNEREPVSNPIPDKTIDTGFNDEQ
jgi:hypothetical protein